MELSFDSVKGSFKNCIAFVVLVFALNAPFAVYAQEDQQDPVVEIDEPAPVQGSSGSASGTLSQGPWGGTGASSSTALPTRVRTGESALRPVGGASTLDNDPGGNPDVPFDSNMNIAFLVVGLVFAFVVYKKRFAVKSEPLNK